MCKLDLKDAYFTIPLHARSHKFTRFQFGGRTYQFPRTLTKVVKPIVGMLRKMGVRMIGYLDDMLIMNSTLRGAREDILSPKYILENLGFVINMENVLCCWPSQVLRGNQISGLRY